MPKRIPNLRGEEGQAVVELALVVPLLLFILFAIIDFGLALNQYNDTTNLSNLAARATAVLSSSNSTPGSCTYQGKTYTTLVGYVDCEGAIQGALSNVAVTVCDASATNSGGQWTINTGDSLSVRVNSTFSWLKILTGGIGRIGGLSNLNTTIGSAATMRAEATSTTATTSGAWFGADANPIPGQSSGTINGPTVQTTSCS